MLREHNANAPKTRCVMVSEPFCLRLVEITQMHLLLVTSHASIIVSHWCCTYFKQAVTNATETFITRCVDSIGACSAAQVA